MKVGEQLMRYGDLSSGQIEALIDKIGVDGVGKLLSGEWIAGEPDKVASTCRKIIADLLELVGDPVELPSVDRFVVRDKFQVDREGELPLSYVGEDFTGRFYGIVEEGIGAAPLQLYRLVRSSIDGPILSALGGEGETRIALAHLFAYLQIADRSKWHFFYVTDAEGMLWAVDSYWRDNGWDIESYSATYPRGWRGGGHVVAR
jgi:hypothetical protein